VVIDFAMGPPPTGLAAVSAGHAALQRLQAAPPALDRWNGNSADTLPRQLDQPRLPKTHVWRLSLHITASCETTASGGAIREMYKSGLLCAFADGRKDAGSVPCSLFCPNG